MISNNVIQAAVVAQLQANTALTNWLTSKSATGEIREANYQGTQFVYPATRVDVGTQSPGPETSICYLTTGETTFTVLSFSEADSSKEADELTGLVNDALMGQRLSGTGFKTLAIQSDGLIHADRLAPRIWRATGLYRMQLYET